MSGEDTWDLKAIGKALHTEPERIEHDFLGPGVRFRLPASFYGNDIRLELYIDTNDQWHVFLSGPGFSASVSPGNRQPDIWKDEIEFRDTSGQRIVLKLSPQ